MLINSVQRVYINEYIWYNVGMRLTEPNEYTQMSLDETPHAEYT